MSFSILNSMQKPVTTLMNSSSVALANTRALVMSVAATQPSQSNYKIRINKNTSNLVVLMW